VSLFCPQYGDVILTVNAEGEQELFTFPAAAGTAHCLDANPAGRQNKNILENVNAAYYVHKVKLRDSCIYFDSNSKLHGLR